jgi:DNA-binding CsgD family transcriptional regulator
MPNSPPSREDVLKTLDIYRRLRPKPEGTIGRVLQDTVLAGPRILRRIGPFPMSDQLAECLKRLAGYCASVGIPAGALVDAAADMDGKRQRVWDAADVAVAALEGWVARSATGEAPDAKRKGIKKPHRRRKTTAVRPLTELQRRALELYGTMNGNIGKIAIEMGITHSTVNQHLKAVWRKLPNLAPKKRAPVGRTQKLPTDNRGQLTTI